MNDEKMAEGINTPGSFFLKKIAGFFRSAPGFNATVIVSFFCLVLVGLLRHEMWRDELQAWMIARDSSSIPNLIANLRYEAHPPLWYFLLFVITRFTSNPVSMQCLHLCIATLCISIFLCYSPFSRLQKALFVFGYFPFYEYAVITRSYSLGVLFLFLFCVHYGMPNKRYAVLFGLLFLASQTHFVAAVLAIFLGIYLIF